VHAANAGALSAAEWWLQVGAWLTAGVPRDLHRQLAAGRDTSGHAPRCRLAPLLAWHERLDQGIGAARHVAKRVRTAGDDHDDDRRTAVEQLVEEVSLYARQPEILDIATLAGGSAPEQTGPVTDKCDAQLR